MCFPERLVDIAKAAHDVVETKPDHLHRCDRVAPLVVAERSVEVLVAASETLHVVVERPCQFASGGDLRRQVRRLDVTRRSRAVVSTVAIAVSRSSVVIPTIMAATTNNFPISPYRWRHPINAADAAPSRRARGRSDLGRSGCVDVDDVGG